MCRLVFYVSGPILDVHFKMRLSLRYVAFNTYAQRVVHILYVYPVAYLSVPSLQNIVITYVSGMYSVENWRERESARNDDIDGSVNCRCQLQRSSTRYIRLASHRRRRFSTALYQLLRNNKRAVGVETSDLRNNRPTDNNYLIIIKLRCF